MDSATRAADPLSSDDRASGPNCSKLARTDTFPLRMQLQNNDLRSSLVRSNSGVVPDCRLGCSGSSTVAMSNSAFDSHHALLAGGGGGGGGDVNYMSDSRLLRSDPLMLASRTMALHHHHQQQQQGLPLKSAAQLTAYGGGVHEMEPRQGEAMVHQLHQQQQQHMPLSLFTPNQVRELQLHALIFKHMVCGVNVPPELVLLVRTSVAALAGMTTGAAAHLGSSDWGNYHLGYGASLDPEPGRCRRTDGKKWRCARDVVPDQKYCERHMHRGRHRAARKPPDPLSSSSSTPSPASSTIIAASSALPRSTVGTPSSSPTTSFLSVAKSSPSAITSSLHLQQQQLTLQAASVKELRALNEEQALFSESGSGVISQGGPPSPAMSGLSVISSAVNSPMGAMQSRQSLLGGGVYESVGPMSREPEGQPLRHFFDDWPRPAGRDASPLTWPEMDGEQQHEQQRASSGVRSASTTQLSISIPSMQAEFGPNGGSPRGGKLALSPLKLSMTSRGDEDPLGVDAATQMGLGVGLGVSEAAEERQRQGGSSSSWVPIAWETSSMGGPLAEVLQSSSNTPRGAGSHAAAAMRGPGLNLMTDAWEGSPRSSSSPTGVLQINATFGCFSSDNSTASSPRSAAALKQPLEPTI